MACAVQTAVIYGLTMIESIDWDKVWKEFDKWYNNERLHQDGDEWELQKAKIEQLVVEQLEKEK